MAEISFVCGTANYISYFRPYVVRGFNLKLLNS